MITKIDPSKNPTVERHVRGLLHELNSGGGKPLETLTPAEARQVLVSAQKGARLPACDVEDRPIEQDGLQVKITVVRPKGATGVLPVFMFFHGGGWILGDYPTHERFVRDLVVDTGYAAVFVNYTPSPEAHYPTAINEAFAATKWVALHGGEINVDPNRLAIVGNSVGGNMTAVIALMAKAKGGPAIKCQVMFWPVTDANFETESYNQYDEGYFLTKPMMKWFWEPTRLTRNNARRSTRLPCRQLSSSSRTCRQRWCRRPAMMYCATRAKRTPGSSMKPAWT
jgi:acetyl esterase